MVAIPNIQMISILLAENSLLGYSDMTSSKIVLICILLSQFRRFSHFQLFNFTLQLYSIVNIDADDQHFQQLEMSTLTFGWTLPASSNVDH
jgi:hypothetical protein